MNAETGDFKGDVATPIGPLKMGVKMSGRKEDLTKCRKDEISNNLQKFLPVSLGQGRGQC